MSKDKMTTQEIMTQVVTGIIDSTVTVETTIAKCFELKHPIMEKLVFNEYLDWHQAHADDLNNPTIFLHDLVIWTQERTRHHINSSAMSRTVN